MLLSENARPETPADGDRSLTLISAFSTRATCGTADKQAKRSRPSQRSKGSCNRVGMSVGSQ
jgi:hypothetical protein